MKLVYCNIFSTFLMHVYFDKLRYTNLKVNLNKNIYDKRQRVTYLDELKLNEAYIENRNINVDCLNQILVIHNAKKTRNEIRILMCLCNLHLITL